MQVSWNPHKIQREYLHRNPKIRNPDQNSNQKAYRGRNTKSVSDRHGDVTTTPASNQNLDAKNQ